MKKFLFALCILLTGSLSAQTAQKLGHIDRQALMLMLPERKDAEAKMQAFAGSLDAKLKAMGEEYKSKVAEYQPKIGTMTQTEKDVAQRELDELQQRIADAQEKAKDDLDKQQDELLQPMVDKTNKAIKDVATENNFTYIFDSSTGMVLFYDNGVDIMPLVKKKLGLQ